MYSVKTAICILLSAFFINIIISPLFIKVLEKIKIGQYVRDEGPQSHQKKAGTPTMGGLTILISIIISSLIFMQGDSRGLAILFVTISFGFVGFLDDYLKIAKKNSEGLSFLQKIMCQLFITLVFMFYVLKSGIGTELYIPFTEMKMLDFKSIYIPFFIIGVLGTVNGVNLTDGIDGLVSGITVMVVTFFGAVALTVQSGAFPISMAVVGALLGFLLFNAYPAKVFMGDTGSMALGGFVAAIAFMLKMPLFIIIVGIIYMIECLSVIIQVLSCKIRKGKRFFKMAPIHHHFELCGWSETKIVSIFYIVTAVACMIGYIAIR